MIDEKKLIERLWEQHKGIKGNAECYTNAEEVANEICNVVSIIDEQPKVGEWIPVSEKLPDTKNKPYKLVLIQTKTSMCVGCMNAAGQWFGEDGTGWGTELKDEVIAWMPLPEPYTESEG